MKNRITEQLKQIFSMTEANFSGIQKIAGKIMRKKSPNERLNKEMVFK